MSTERESAEKNEQGCGPDSCARLKPSMREIVQVLLDRNLTAQADDDRHVAELAARDILALFPGRTEAEVWDEAWQAGAHAGLDTGLQIAENVHANGGVLDLTALPPSPYRA